MDESNVSYQVRIVTHAICIVPAWVVQTGYRDWSRLQSQCTPFVVIDCIGKSINNRQHSQNKERQLSCYVRE